MNNQSGQPEKVAAFGQPEIGRAPTVPSGGVIINFRQPVTKPLESKAIDLTAITSAPASGVVEGLRPDEDSHTGGVGLSKADIRDIALHRAKKAA